MFSSKGRRRALDEEDNEKKGSFLGKLNKPLFSSKGKHKEHLSIQGVQIKSDRQEDFDDEEKSTAKGSFLTKLNKPLFSKNSGSDDMPAKSGNRSLFAKKEIQFNQEHGIAPTSIQKAISDGLAIFMQIGRAHV